jgi:MoaA/NifB/PqqE/SkfB family radical SAM enzyme
VACSPQDRAATLEQVLATDPGGPDRPLVLGGGDATQWPQLDAFLSANAQRPQPHRVWLEGPATSFTTERLTSFAARGVAGVRVQLDPSEATDVIARAESAGLQTEARLCASPATIGLIGPLARQLSPRMIWLEFATGVGEKIPTEQLDAILMEAPNVRFSSHRLRGSGFPPPCVMPRSYRANPHAWKSTLADRKTPQNLLAACGDCRLNLQCQWTDVGALSPAALAAATPMRKEAPERRIQESPVPEIIVRKRRQPEVVCTEPWTTLEAAGHDGRVYQCGGNWSAKQMGNVKDNTLMEIWNGQPFQQARRMMGQKAVAGLCKPICTRLYDGVANEKRFKIQAGSEAFVRNQLLLAEEIAERKEVLTGMPQHMTLCPSSYCNYNCVFCDYGQRDRVDIPERIWDELPLFLPTLKTLTLLGGEPFASPRVWDFLTTFDTEKFPDVRLDIFTNGALMTEKALRRVKSSALGEITISLNAGSPEVYETVERGTASLGQVMQNVDALIRFRDDYQVWFGITLSLIVMRENAHTLIQFGQLALERNLHIRLVGLLIARPQDEPYNFYKTPDDVRHVIAHLDQFIEWAKSVGRPDYAKQGIASRDAVLGNASQITRMPVSSLVPLRLDQKRAG